MYLHVCMDEYMYKSLPGEIGGVRLVQETGPAVVAAAVAVAVDFVLLELGSI